MPVDQSKVKKVFDEVWQLPPQERASFLQNHCSEPDVREEVEALLQCESESNDFLENSAFDVLHTFAENDVLADRFKIIRILGEGGFGIVYEAEDLQTRDRVAIKTLHSHLLLDSRYLTRFVREVNLAKRVTHPNVCRIYDLFRHKWADGKDVVFVSMELLQGESLAARLLRTGKIDNDEANSIVQQIAEALSASHQANIVHRDLKPENIVLVPGNDAGIRAVITDFGLAYRLTDEHLTASGITAGSPLYMSPEQREGHEITAASDIYALGLVIYEMVTSTRPFKNAAQYIVQEPPSPRRLVPQLDRRLEMVVLKCLQRDPSQRFTTAREIALAVSGKAKLKFVPQSRRRLQRGVAATIALLAVVCTAFTLLTATRPVVLNFDSVMTEKSPYELPATQYLADAGIRLLATTYGSEVVIRNIWHSYKGAAIQTSSPPNVLTIARRTPYSAEPIGFTLGFHKDLCEIDFSRPGLAVATQSGVTHPAWSAHAYDIHDKELASVSEELIRSWEFVPPKIFTLRGKGIRSIRFESDYRAVIGGKLQPFAAFDAALIDDLKLKQCPLISLF